MSQRSHRLQFLMKFAGSSKLGDKVKSTKFYSHESLIKSNKKRGMLKQGVGLRLVSLRRHFLL